LRLQRTEALGMIRRSAALMLIAGGIVTSVRPISAQTAPAAVRIGAMSIDAFGEAYFGNDTGIFVSNGITPQITTLSNGAAIMSAVIGGDLDVGMANTVNVAGAIARGIPVQMIAPASLYSKKDANPNLMIAKTSPIKSPKDLTGATIAVSALGDFNQLSLLAWLDANKVPRDGVHFIEMKFGEMGPAVARGTVQAAIITEPARADAVLAGQVRDFADTYIAVAPEFATIVWFTTKAWLQKNPDAAKKLVNGIYATAKWANAHTDLSAPMLAKAAKMDPAVVAGMRRLYFATANDPKYIEDTLALGSRYGMLPRPVTVAEYTAGI
jgi:NitT/TauT family transport system substrate-binding protein